MEERDAIRLKLNKTEPRKSPYLTYDILQCLLPLSASHDRGTVAPAAAKQSFYFQRAFF